MKKLTSLIWLVCFLSVNAFADDTEVYLGNPDANTVKPNVLFIFDTSGSMANKVCIEESSESVCAGGYNTWNGFVCTRWKKACKVEKSRLQITQEAAKKTLNKLSGINVGLMQFNDKYSGSNYGGYIDLPVRDLDDNNHRNAVLQQIDKYQALTWTPITETVHEAYLYMTGQEVKYGKSGSARYSHKDSYQTVGSKVKYISPVTESCQKNHIVLFTDGASTYDGESDTAIRKIMSDNFSAADLAGTGLGFNCSTNNTNEEGKKTTTSCLQDIAFAMNRIPAGNEKQSIQFHAIGGFIGGALQDTLDAAARFGGGLSANAQNPEDLEEALLKVFHNIVQSGGTFAAPSVSVNAFNNLQQLDQIYYSVFKPHEAVGWSGNVKRYRLAGEKIVDANGNEAIDPDSGFFKSAAQSFWSQSVDGDGVTAGGMANRLQDDRKIVSNLVGNNLMDTNNRIQRSNSNVTRDLMGTRLMDQNFNGSDVDPSIGSGAVDSYDANEFSKLVNWVGGLEARDGSNKSRRSMEDPLHSTPVLLNYGELNIEGKRVPDSTMFIGTNSGYLHAFDTNINDPKERFAFIPKELLPVATKYYEGVGEKKYGLDGHITAWHDDTNKDRIINNGEKAYLYVGMRRGGSSYYALDVSNRDQPKLLWQINGKGHANGATPGFNELGQTWSKAQLADVMWDGQKRKVLIFAGGYDISQDTNLTRKDDDVGNAIFMVDAKTGSLLWKASKSTGNLKIANMKNAITGNVVAVDDNSDGYVDLLYVADLGGRIFRIDFNREEAKKASTNAANYATGGMIADLGANNTQISHVRFYDTLDVVYTREFSWVEGAGDNKRFIEKPRYMLSIGSGYRAHPLDNSAQDNFYVVFDYNTEGPALNAQGKPVYTSVAKADLQNYQFSGTGNLNIKPTTKSNNGFYLRLIDFDSGEKVLSSSITINNTIYFTSFRPSDGTSSNSCTADLGNSRLYRITLKSGDQSLITEEDIQVPGIAPQGVVIRKTATEDDEGGIGEGDDAKLLISTQVIDIENPEYPLKKTFWREMEQE